MGILDMFKKASKEDKEEKIDLTESNLNNNVIEEQDHIDINISEIDTLNSERCEELIAHVLKDKDFGEEFIKDASIREIIFITVYMRQRLLKQFETKEMEDLHEKLVKTIEVFEDLLFEKVMKLDKLWKIINKATGCPVIDNSEEHILISDLYKDKMIEDYERPGIKAEAVELNHDQFVNELNDLYRIGYSGIRFSDGRQSPCILKRERMLKAEDAKKSDYPINPKTYFTLAAYLQEFRRGASGDEASNSLNTLGRAMIANLINTKFIIPVQEIDENQFKLPMYVADKNEQGEVTSIGLYVFTDEVEMKKIEYTGIKLDDSWKVQVDELKDVIDKVEGCNISEICINFATTQFRLDRKTIESLKRDSGIASREDEIRKRQEAFDKNELPKILDSKTDIVKAPNNMPVFIREEGRVCINNYVINSLDKKNMYIDALNSFFEDKRVKEIRIFDVHGKKADIKICDDGEKSGIFILPMRYDCENDNEPIKDETIHYSLKAAQLQGTKDGNNSGIVTADKTMHFFTIVNSNNNNNYLPIFNDVEEAKKIFSNNKFRFCAVTYDDILDNSQLNDGIVIGPTTLSTVIPKEFINKIYDISME